MGDPVERRGDRPAWRAVRSIAGGDRDSRPEASHAGRSLRVYLIAMSVALVVPSLVLCVYLTSNLVHSEMASGRERLQRAAYEATRDVDREVAGLFIVLETLATSRALAADDLPGFHGSASRALAGTNAYVLLLDRSLRQILNTRVPYGTELPSTAHPESARHVVETGLRTVSGVFTGAVSGRRVVNLLVPIRRDGSVRYVLLITVYASRFDAVLREVIRPEWTARLADQNNHTIGSIGRVGEPLEGATTAPRNVHGVTEARASNGEVLLAASRRSGTTGWTVSVAAPKALVDASFWQSVRWLGAASLLSLGLAAAFCVYLSRQMTDAMGYLRSATRRLARGEVIPVRPLPVTEANIALEGLARASRLIEARSQELADSEARCRQALRVGRMGSWDANLVLGTRTWSPEAIEVMGLPQAGISGKIGGPDDELRAIIHPDDRHLLDGYHAAFLDRDEIDAAYRIVLPDGTIRHLAGHGKVVQRTPEGKPALVTNVMADVTERTIAFDQIAAQKQQLEAEKARYQALVKVSAQIEWTTEADGTTLEDSPTWRQFTGQSYQDWVGTGWLDAVHPDDRERTKAAWHAAVEEAGEYQVDYRLRRADGTYCWTTARGVALKNSEGRLLKWVGSNEDISERKAREEHLEVVMRELSHRTKNLLAVIQSIARRSFGGQDTAQAFNERLSGLAVSHDLLVRCSWRGTSLEDLVHAHLQPFAAGRDQDITIAGPFVSLRPQSAQSIGLALHELATNALKYGALSAGGGTIEVTWRLASPGGDLRLDWRERLHEPVPAPSPSVHLGFGRTLLDRVVASSLSGSSGYTIDGREVHWWIEAPADGYQDGVSEGDHASSLH
ncbi:MAG: PAS domain-containing protein [Hyphomicrobiaceae bacterium]